MSFHKRLEDNDPVSPRVIIIGGGIGGITAGIALKKQLGHHNFTIYERSDDIGGTWHLNTYPGCASDVATHWYSLSTELNPNWKQTHVSQPELKAYWKDLAGKYQLYGHISLFSDVVGADWDAARQMYRVEIRDVRTGATRTDYANAIISALGILDVPYYPKDLAGIQSRFKGEHFHSARWNHNVSLHNKRVAVIGNGCSAAQFVPVITEDPTTEVVSFVRTPVWVVPGVRSKYSEFQQKIFRYVPFAMRFYRLFLNLRQEMLYLRVISGGRNAKPREELMTLLRGYIKAKVPAEYVEKLTPNFPAGCKRFIIDTGYYEALHRPNNNLNFDGIAEANETGILTKKGELLEFDVIIEATGFMTDEYPLKIRGVNGVSMQDYNREQGGPTAYRGTTVPGFPNFFTLAGPNTGTGHGSVVYTEEVQVNYVMQLLKPVLRGHASSFEVTHEATDSWNKHIHAKLSASVWSFCQSWYRMGHTGRNTVMWPGPMVDQWWSLLWPEWKHYKAVGARRWAVGRFLTRLRRIVMLGGLLMACVGCFMYPDGARQISTRAKYQIRNLLLGTSVL